MSESDPDLFPVLACTGLITNCDLLPLFIFKLWLDFLNGDCAGERLGVCAFGVPA